MRLRRASLRRPATPPARRLPLHRRSPASLLVLGGSSAQRREVARECHELGPAGTAPFLALDCAHEESRLAAALECWLTSGGTGLWGEPLPACAGGMLFLDSVSALSPATQRLLLLLAIALQTRLPGAPHGGRPARLAAGDPGELPDAVASQTFSRALFDCLDKIRVELPLPARSGAA